jgi:phage baseplate assembly protein W
VTAIRFPWTFDAQGRTARSGLDAHVREMIEQLLFTEPGERVNRPDLGSGVRRMVFGPNSPEVASALRFVIQGGLERWLGDVLRIEALDITSVDATLAIDLSYTVLATGETITERFERSQT